MLELLSSFGFSFGAVYIFTILFCSPKRTRLISALIGAVSYTTFVLLGKLGVHFLVAYFFSTMIIAISSEIFAVLQKAPSTCFTNTAIIALVPGIGLYQTMNLFTFGKYEQGGEIGIQTLLSIGTMAMALAVSLMLIRLVHYLVNNIVVLYKKRLISLKSKK